MTPEQQAFLAKKKEKAAARRQKGDDKTELGITSLMDIVSIIVVYLLKSYASDPVVINPSAGQKIPLSTADAPMQDGIPIFVTQRGIIFDNKKLVPMDSEGNIDKDSVKDHLIGPLYDALAEEVDKAKTLAENTGKPWSGRAILVGDQDLKFSALVDVMYTAGRAEFSEYSFCIIRKS